MTERDAAWVKQRTREFKAIRRRLKKLGTLKEWDLIQMEAHYLGNESHIGELNFFYGLWLSPDGPDAWPTMLRNATARQRQEARQMFRYLAMHDKRALLDGLESQFATLLYPEERRADRSLFSGARGDTSSLYGVLYLQEAGRWLIADIDNPYCYVQYLDDLFWEALPSDEEQARAEHRLQFGARRDNYNFLCQCAHYIEPRALPGTDTPQRRFAMKMREALSTRALPNYFAEWWELVQTPEGRASVWLGRETQPPTKDRDDLTWYQQKYSTAIAHADEPRRIPLVDIVSVFDELGFATEPYRSDGVRDIDLTKHLHGGLVERLGYAKGAKVAGYCYTLKTTPEFADADRSYYDVDIVVPSVGPNPKKAIPQLIVLPRPKDWYDDRGIFAFELNLRMARRLIRERLGIDLMRYWEQRMDDATDETHYVSKNQPFKKLLKLGEDLPAWKGEKLPPPDEVLE